MEYSVVAILQLLFMVHIALFPMLNLLYCTFTVVLSAVCVPWPIWLFSAVPWFRVFSDMLFRYFLTKFLPVYIWLYLRFGAFDYLQLRTWNKSCLYSVLAIFGACNVICHAERFLLSEVLVSCPVWLFFCSSLISCFPGMFLSYYFFLFFCNCLILPYYY
jgi:hypothetical protein